ncbi:hypothetical protein EAH81_10295 [Flavobacterium pectinovorum]|uniref:Uncharacterized protein n=1 Tax=Flavobacterium pectinovorum TaxID=29533 RepID=A0A502ET56_9FLAO|nr:hypothetical protein EAH81_10295 [Flavobacterium pectinovorum]
MPRIALIFTNYFFTLPIAIGIKRFKQMNADFNKKVRHEFHEFSRIFILILLKKLAMNSRYFFTLPIAIGIKRFKQMYTDFNKKVRHEFHEFTPIKFVLICAIRGKKCSTKKPRTHKIIREFVAIKKID